MTWLSLGNVTSVVVEVKKFENEGESVSFQDLSGLSYISMRCAIFNPRSYCTISLVHLFSKPFWGQLL